MQSAELVAVDVGAARGLLPHWRPLARCANLVMVEPDREAHPEIVRDLERQGARGNYQILPVALGAAKENRTLHVWATRTSSSLLPIRPDAFDLCDRSKVEPIREVQIETTTLEAVLDEAQIDRVDLIKLDTQGTELEILKALDEPRRRLLLSAELEIGMPGAYLGQPHLGTVSDWLDSQGFELFDIVPKRGPLMDKGAGAYHRIFKTYRNAPSLAQRIGEVDAFFFKKPALVLERDASAVRRLSVAYCLYGFFAEAYRLIEQAASSKLLAGTDAAALHHTILAWHRNRAIRRAPFDLAAKVVQKAEEHFSTR